MSKIVIFGAGGRLGRLAVAEAVRRGHTVTAAVREPSRHPDLGADLFAAPRPDLGADLFAAPRPDLPAASPVAVVAAGAASLSVASRPGLPAAPSAHIAAASRSELPAVSPVRFVAADATDPGAVAAVAAGHDAAIASLYQQALPHDVFYAGATAALLSGLAGAGVGRLLFVGMAANLETTAGARVMDSPGFAPGHLPFALGHTVALHVLRAAETPVDWLMLTPPMRFEADGDRTGAYRTGGDAVLGEHLSYADFAIALLDEIDGPAHHRTRIAVAA